MKRRTFLAALIITGVAISIASPLHAEDAKASKPFLHPLFTNDMVLQRDVPDPIWGWTEPGKQVTVSINGKTVTTTADAQGKWMAKLPPEPAGGPFELTVTGGPQEVKLTNVLLGDVWLCSGQSNMEMGIGNVNNAQQEIAQADNPKIRLFSVTKKIAYTPQELLNSGSPKEDHWLACTSQNLVGYGWNGFSAVGYFFGREVQKQTGIPIGLIHSSWGGTLAEAWTSDKALSAMPDFKDQLAQVKAQSENKDSRTHEEQMKAWYAKGDPGSKTGDEWFMASTDDGSWKTIKNPGYFEQAGVGLEGFDGVVWYRKQMELPADLVGKDLELHLGAIDDNDTTWVNGTQVGATDGASNQRVYKVPASAVKDAKLTIAVRVLDTGGNGGFTGDAQAMKLQLAGDAAHSLPLAGEWKLKAGAPLNTLGTAPGNVDNNPNIVTVLYNGMINPLLPFSIKGAIWYQGESNAGRAMQYRTLLPTMIRDWRSRFGVGDFPFYIVQLAAFQNEVPTPQDSAWAQLREAQDMTARTVGHSGIAVATDIGDAKDIHPKNKQDVGRRLALNALALDYGKDIEYSGPVYTTMKIDGPKVTVEFAHLGGGLEAKGGELKGFAIAGADGKFQWADAKIEGDKVVLSSPQVPQPVAVRYGWADNPAKANLFNKAGLPAGPFRTDVPK